jgi:RNA polymerase sigma factor (sigma-70 family)
MSDAEAMRRLRGDPDAICVLYDRYVARLVAVLARRCGDPEVAFEVAQETFARALEHGHRVRLEPEGSAWPWLAAVGRNLLSDWHRRGAVDVSARARLRIASAAYDAGSIEDLLDRLDAAELAQPLARALDELPASHREAIRGRVAGELSYAELAAAHSTTEQVIRTRVSRGLRAMRSRLLEVGP